MAHYWAVIPTCILVTIRHKDRVSSLTNIPNHANQANRCPDSVVYIPLKRGGLFSRKAWMPSLWSCVWASMVPTKPSLRICAS